MQKIQKLVEISGHSGAIYTADGFENVAFTGSGDQFVAKWKLDEGRQDAFAIKAESAVYALRLIHQNKQLIFGCSSGDVHVVDLENRQEIKHFTQHKVAIFSIAENPTKQHVYITDADGNLSVWHSDSWKLLILLPLNVGKIRNMFLDESDKLLFLAGQDGFIRVFDTQRFNELIAFDAHKLGANCCTIFPQKKHLLLTGGKDGFLRVWNWKEGKQILEIPAHNFGIYSILFLQDGKSFITTSRDKSIKFWDATTLNVLQKIERKHGGHSHAVNASFKESETRFVTVGDDKRVIQWEVVSSF